MEFDQIPLRCPAIQLASWSQTSSEAGRRPGFRPVADRFELSRHLEIARTWSQTGSQLVAPARELIRELLASWIAPDRPNSITLSSSLADRRPAREPTRETRAGYRNGIWPLPRFSITHRNTVGR